MKNDIDLAQEVLDAYFQFRRNLPEDGAIQDYKTSEDIQDDLLPMLDLSKERIVEYLTDNSYNMVTDADGSVKWAIWRIIM